MKDEIENTDRPKIPTKTDREKVKIPTDTDQYRPIPTNTDGRYKSEAASRGGLFRNTENISIVRLLQLFSLENNGFLVGQISLSENPIGVLCLTLIIEIVLPVKYPLRGCAVISIFAFLLLICS